MNAKVWWVGLGGGVVATGALIYPLYVYFPGGIVKGWQSGSALGAWILGILSILLLPAIGALAARLSGLKSRSGAGVAGAVAGGISALMAFVFIIGSAAGVWGSRGLLAHGLEPYTDNTIFITALLDSVSAIILWSFIAFWATNLAGILLGFLGGLAAGPGGRSGEHMKIMAVPMSLVGLICAALVFVISTSAALTLTEIIQKAADKINYSLLYPSLWISLFAALSSLIYLWGWQLLVWQALRMATEGATTGPVSWDLASLASGLMPLILVFLFSWGNRAQVMKYPLASLMVVLLTLAMGFPSLRVFWKLRDLPRPAKHERIPFRYFLAGIAVLFFMLVFGLAFGGAGAALSLVMLPIVMLQTLIPLESAVSVPSVIPGGLPGLVRNHYLVIAKSGSVSLAAVVLLIVLVTLIAWLVDWYGLRLVTWLQSRLHPKADPGK
jgi:hypothetical protein